MTRLKILSYPDPRLSEVCQPVTAFDEDLHRLSEDLLETMRIDQLDGMFWLQRLSRLKRERLIKKWEKAARR
ncbi:peptide deformylase [Neorhizobium sp. NPDC001467]|uniref:peptide deformylase n=1 Tax=Neorhizobium sp. NPDC001467 TaxID=3390595 RepID=UPI003CFFC506